MKTNIRKEKAINEECLIAALDNKYDDDIRSYIAAFAFWIMVILFMLVLCVGYLAINYYFFPDGETGIKVAALLARWF